MSEGIVSNGIPVDQSNCRCTVCTSAGVRKVLSDISDLSKETRGIFSSAVGNVNSGMYKSLLRLSDDSKQESSCSLSDKFIVVLAVLLAIIIIACTVFVFLKHKGIIHIPGVSTEMMNNITKWIGPGLCVASFSYLMISLSCLVGCRVGGDDKKCKIVRALNRSRLRKSVVEQKEKWDGLSRAYNELLSDAASYRGSASESAYTNVNRILEVEREIAQFKTKYDELNCEYTKALVERDSIRRGNKELCSEFNGLVRKNLRLSNQNSFLKEKLGNCASRLDLKS